MAVGAAGRGKFAGWMACGAFYAASGMSALPGQRATRRHRAFGEARKLASCRVQLGAPPLPTASRRSNPARCWEGCGAVCTASGMSALPGQRATRRHRAFGEARKLASCRVQLGAPPLPTASRRSAFAEYKSALQTRICWMDGLRRCLCGERDARVPRLADEAEVKVCGSVI